MHLVMVVFANSDSAMCMVGDDIYLASVAATATVTVANAATSYSTS